MIFTSEQVSNGHPDKICDQISDAILTYLLQKDKGSRVAVETMIKDYDIFIVGEVTSNAILDSATITRIICGVLTNIDLNVNNFTIHTNISKQSPDIAIGVDNGGAGDQGMMFGYATNETPEMLPIPYAVATYALQILDKERNHMLGRDAKSQVSFDYDNHKITTFLISTYHKEEFETNDFKNYIIDVMKRSAEHYGLNTDFDILINPTGRFVTSSSFADSGLTGRKIIADTYGGMCRHGGGAFSGKDCSKVDRSGAYIARKIAKDLVSKGYCKKCEIQIAYAIGVAEPVSINIETFGTTQINTSVIEEYIKNKYDLTPQGIIKELNLLNIDYTKTSTYGHFGNKDLPWEKI